jgi:uncharacterized protein YbcV (DUF1398 family)
MNTQDKLQKALDFAMTYRPTTGGFPFLAECLRQAEVSHNLWTLPSAQSVYMFESGWVVNQGTPLVSGMVAVEKFDEEALIVALRANQAGESTFPEFLEAIWQAGVVGYDVDFSNRTVTYMGAGGDIYTEEYPAADVVGLEF